MKYCTKCIIPETSETIGFDQKGVCTVCNQVEYKNEIINWEERNDALKDIIKKYKGKYAYDCIVPFSGGKTCFCFMAFSCSKKIKTFSR